MKIVHIVCIFKDFPYLCKLKVCPETEMKSDIGYI